MDWLPTGQWSAASSTVYERGSQITLCQLRFFVDSSNLEIVEALSRYLQLLLLIWPDVNGTSHLTSGCLPVITAGDDIKVAKHRPWRLDLDIRSTMLYLIRQYYQSSCPT